MGVGGTTLEESWIVGVQTGPKANADMNNKLFLSSTSHTNTQLGVLKCFWDDVNSVGDLKLMFVSLCVCKLRLFSVGVPVIRVIIITSFVVVVSSNQVILSYV